LDDSVDRGYVVAESLIQLPDTSFAAADRLRDLGLGSIWKG